MKKPIRTHESSSPDQTTVSCPAGAMSRRPNVAIANAIWRITECFAWLLTVLLPIKFASFVSAPEAGALYWTDPFSLVVISWPLPVFKVSQSPKHFLRFLPAPPLFSLEFH